MGDAINISWSGSKGQVTTWQMRSIYTQKIEVMGLKLICTIRTTFYAGEDSHQANRTTKGSESPITVAQKAVSHEIWGILLRQSRQNCKKK